MHVAADPQERHSINPWPNSMLALIASPGELLYRHSRS